MILGLIAAWAFAGRSLSAQSVTPRISAEVSSAEVSPLQGSQHPFAQPQHEAGRVPSDTKLTGITIAFSRSAAQQADLDALITAQQNPASPLYHQWLTPDQFAARFGMAQADLDKVSAWLEQQGFVVTSVARSRTSIHFDGTASQVERAFATEMHYYQVGGEKHFAPSTELSVPTAFLPVVLGVTNLNDFRPKPMHVLRAKPAFTWNQNGDVFFAPGDIEKAYDIPVSDTGAGQSIAIVGQSAISASDIEAFDSAASITKGPISQVLVPGTGASTVSPGDETESDLDLEWSGAIAPGANMFFVYTGSSDTTGVIDALAFAVDEGIAQIISISYGYCEEQFTTATIAPYEAVGQQAVAQGQTIIASSGDTGSTGCYGQYGSGGHGTGNAPVAADEEVAVNYPASSAYVTGVGGTEITAADSTSTNSTYWLAQGSNSILNSLVAYIPEVAWNDDAQYQSVLTNGGTWQNVLSATGGGPSAIIANPTWQTGVTGIPASSNRLVPDVSLYSSPDYPGYLFCTSDTSAWSSGQQASCSNDTFLDAVSGYPTVAGGTSFAAPIFAGMVAIINQEKGYTSGQGLINPTLYTLAANNANYSLTTPVFHDITAGSSAGTPGVGNECLASAAYCLSSSGSTTDFPTTAGYDQATGLGSVDLGNLLGVWPQSTTTLIGTATSITASPTAPAIGATDTFTITVTAADGVTTPTGTVSLCIDGNGTNCTGGTTATAPLTSSTAGVATATYQTAFTTSGIHVVVAHFAATATLAASTGTVEVNVAAVSSGVGTITLTASPATLTVAQGASGTETLTITPSGGYLGTVLLNFSSSNDTALANLCLFAGKGLNSTGAVVVTSASTVNGQVVFDTLASDCNSLMPAGSKTFHRFGGTKTAKNNGSNPAPFGIAFAGLLLAGFLGRRSRKFLTMTGLIAMLTASFAISACSSSTTNSSIAPTNPPKGTYTITVTGTDSLSSKITAQTSFQFVIQ
jgi:subtilase family serine protease